MPLVRICSSSVPELTFSDPERTVDHYWSLVATVSPGQRDEFLSRQAQPDLEPHQRTEALRLLDLRRNCQLMFTSCAWFFDDISGIEPVQILRYAARAIGLARRLGAEFEEDFLEDLSSAKSNLEIKGDGRKIFQRLVQKDVFDAARVAGHVGFHILFQLPCDRVVTASSDNTAKIWDSLSGQLLATLQGHRNSVGSAVSSPDGSRIVTASQDRTAKVWEVATGRLLFSLEDHDKGLTEGAFSPRCQNRYRQLRHDRQSVGCAQWPAAGHTRRSLG